MFREGDYVSKVGNGICRILQVSELSFGKKEKRTYYELEPVYPKGSKLYVPVDQAENRMRPVMNQEEALQLIAEIPFIDPITIENEKHREKQYQTALQSNEPKQLARIIKVMYLRKEERLLQGKKNTALEEHYFKIAEDCLFQELCLALGEDQELVMKRIEQVAGESTP